MADLIDRQAAIDELHKGIIDFFDFCGDDEESPMTYMDERLLEINKAIANRLKQLTSADVQPVRHGHWMLRKADSGFHTDCVCSECKRKHAIGWDYCPNCGARMDGEQNE